MSEHSTVPDGRLMHVRILASAGSGKTWQLTMRYLQLLALGADPSTIVASTFTRAAAGEIRDRILHQLASACLELHSRDELSRTLGVPLDADRCVEMLRRLTGRMHALHVRTLDSLFAAILRCFSLELGIPVGSRLVEAERGEAMRRAAIRRMLDEADPQPLINLLRELLEGGEQHSVMSQIEKTISTMFESALQSAPEAWNWIKPYPAMDAVSLEAAVNSLATMAPPEIARHRNAWLKDVETLRQCRHWMADGWNVFLSKGLAKPIAAGTETFHSLSISPDLVAMYQPIIDHARAVMRDAIIRKTAACHDLLNRFGREYATVKRELRAIEFADLSTILAAAGTTRLADDLYYRLDSRVEHLLLDEMQDTSIEQWRVLKPLVEEIVSHRPPDRTFFCVGDTKQSIYGWRNAEPVLLERMSELLGYSDESSPIARETLQHSYRSTEAIIEFVNAVFERMSVNPCLSENFAEVAADWDSQYIRHETMRKSPPGYVRVAVCAEPDSDASSLGPQQRVLRVRLNQAASLAAELYHAAPERSIGILVRTNASVQTLLHALGPAGEGVPATGRGGGSLTDTPPVNAILDLLRLADHPGDTVAAFNVQHSPLGEALGIDPRHRSSRQRHELAAMVRNRVQREGYAYVIDDWIRMIAPACSEHQLVRLVELQGLAERHDADRTIRCDDFVRLVEQTRVPGRSSGGIEVMTIHQSKGLQFDAVIVPDLDSQLARPPSHGVVVRRQGLDGPIDRVCARVRTSMWSQFDDVSALFEREKARLARESLSVLYVALTRAKDELHVLLKPSSRSEKGKLPKTLDSVVRSAVLGAQSVQPGEVIAEFGDSQWREARRAPATQDGDTRIDVPNVIVLPQAARPRAVMTPSPSTNPAGTMTIDDMLRTGPIDARDAGTAIHALFETVGWFEEWDQDDTSLLALLRRLPMRRDDEWRSARVVEFRKMLQNPTVSELLSLGERSDQEVELRRELRVVRQVEGRIQTGIIDRLELDHSASSPHAHIIDFKTDMVTSDQAGVHAQKYQGQLVAYRDAVKALYPQRLSIIRCSLVFVRCGMVIDLSP